MFKFIKFKKFLSQGNFLIISVIILFSVFLLYKDLLHSFFEQDEWLSFENLIYAESVGGIKRVILDAVYYNAKVHIVPLTMLSFFLQFKLFGISFEPYAVVSIINHGINSILVYYLAVLLFKKKFLAFLSALIFSLSSISSQSITWIAASITTLPATTFLLIAIIFCIKYFSSLEKNKKLLFISLFMAMIGLLFKETVVVFFFLLPICWFIYAKERNIAGLKKTLIPLLVLVILYFLLRLPSGVTGTFSTSSSSNIKPWIKINAITYLYRSVTYPLKILTQSVITETQIYRIADKIIYLAYPQYFAYSEKDTNPYITQTVISDLISYGFSVIILLVCFIIYNFYKKKHELELSKTLAFSVLIITMSALPYIPLKGTGGFFSIFEPRHLYVATVGSSLLIILLIYGLFSLLFHKQKTIYLLMSFVLFPLFFVSIQTVKTNINFLVKMGDTRKFILSEISRKHITLPQKIIFYTVSDGSYYGISEKILPFQSGLGQILLVWYKEQGENFPSCFYTNDFLYRTEEEGYKECQGRGFGYFRNLDLVKDALYKNHLLSSSVIAYSWNSKRRVLTEITSEVRKLLEQSHF